MAFKSTPTPFSELTVGTPVIITDPSAFNPIPGGPLTTGVISGFGMCWYGADGKYMGQPLRTLQLTHTRAGQATTITLVPKGVNEGFGYGLGIPPTSTVFSVLTGATGRRLQKKYLTAILSGESPIRIKGSMSFSIGCDPEIFCTTSDGSVIPAWKYLPSKASPVKSVCPSGTNGISSAYWDGFQAEFSTTAQSCAGWMIDHIRDGLQLINTRARAHSPTARLSIASCPYISPETMDSAEDRHATFGCFPSLNAYGSAGEVVDEPRNLNYRFAGGHIHIGNRDCRTDPVRYIQAIDAIVGIASVGMFANLDSPLRRRYYGLAGEYRLPLYGIEYRTLSNAWLCHPAIAFWVFDMIRAAVQFEYLGLRRLCQPESPSVVESIINSGDVRAARKYCRKYSEIYTLLAKQYYKRTDAGDLTLNLIENGVETICDPSAIEENWQFPSAKAGSWAAHGSESAGRHFNTVKLLNPATPKVTF